MKTLKNIFLTSILLTFSLNASASVNDEMISLLKKYEWYEDLKSYEENIRSESILEYHIRFSVAKYLENVDLYDAGDTKNCTDTDDFPYHNKNIDTCYNGTYSQNFGLLNALKTPEVKRHLGGINAYIIVNGIDDVFLKYMESNAWTRDIAERMKLVPK